MQNYNRDCINLALKRSGIGENCKRKIRDVVWSLHGYETKHSVEEKIRNILIRNNYGGRLSVIDAVLNCFDFGSGADNSQNSPAESTRIPLQVRLSSLVKSLGLSPNLGNEIEGDLPELDDNLPMYRVSYAVAKILRRYGHDSEIVDKFTHEIQKHYSSAPEEETNMKNTITGNKGAESSLSDNLKLMIEYERHCLQLMKEYEDQIRFVCRLQEDLRRERLDFWRNSFRDIDKVFEETKVDPEVKNLWLKSLVETYNESLDLSASLIRSSIDELLLSLREQASNLVSKSDKGPKNHGEDAKENG